MFVSLPVARFSARGPVAELKLIENCFLFFFLSERPLSVAGLRYNRGNRVKGPGLPSYQNVLR